MKLQLLTAVAATAMMVAPSMAHADDHDEGWYLRGNVGYGAHTDADLVGDVVGDVESEGNVAGSLGVGYDFGNNWRLELDGTSLWTDMGRISQVPESFAKIRTNTAMLNAIYDFDDFDRWAPYVGAGLGIVNARASIDAHDFIASGGNYVDNPTCLGAATCRVDDKASGIAWQIIAGLGYDITDNLVWDTNYRYQNFADLDYDALLDGSTIGDVDWEDAGAHLLMTGFRYHFGGKAAAPMMTCWDGSQAKMLADCPDQPAPPPATKICWDGSEILASSACPVEPVRMQTCWDGSELPVTSTCPPQRQSFVCNDGTVVFDSIANCPSGGNVTVGELCANQTRQEIIYYEFDKGQSPETAATIRRILDTAAYCSVGNVRVIGHTDRSGSAAYNLGLSQRRAKDARDELVSQGVNAAIITSEGKGETDPFIPTADGVKEQLNRRTEVLITLTDLGVITN